MKPRCLSRFLLLAIFTLLILPCLTIAVATEDRFEGIEPTGVKIKLVGTAVAYQPSKSIAVVEIDGRNQIYLREGDVVDRFLIKEILRDRIIVDSGYGEETVKLRQSLSAGTKTKTASAYQRTPRQSFGPRPPEGRNLKVVYLDRDTKKSMFGDISGLLKEMRVDPVSVYGKPMGIRISPIEPGSIFSEMGLKSNEVIREVNGKAVTGPEDAIALFQQMKSGGEFDIKVKGRRTRQIHMIVE